MKFNLYDYIKIQAFESYLNEDDQYFYRKVCRWYSTEFHTPLTEVEKLPWDYILLHYYESSLEKMDYNDVLDLAIEEYVPEIVEEQEKDTDAFVKEVEEMIKRKKEQSLKNKSTIQDSKPPTQEFQDIEIDFTKDFKDEEV